MTRRHLAFLNIAVPGHVNPTLPVVAELVARGHRVTYATTGPLAEQVAAAGAQTLHYAPEPPAVRIADAEQAAVAGFFESVGPLPGLVEHFTADPPDLVVHDMLAGAPGAALARRCGVPRLQLSPSFASNDHFSLLAACAPDFALDPTRLPMYYRATVQHFLDKHGIDETPERFVSLVPAPGERTVAFLPRAFQIEGGTFDDRFSFVGASLGDRVHESGWAPSHGDAPVALVSLGTLYTGDAGFFRRCVEAFAGRDWHAVVVVGPHLDPADLGALPPNVEVHRHVPQIAVLRHAAVLVGHAGMGSTMEALAFGVPLVVAPQQPEQRVVAGRIVELGLGRRLGDDEVTGETVRAAVEDVVADTAMRDRVGEMARAIRDSGGARRAADVIVEAAEQGAPAGTRG